VTLFAWAGALAIGVSLGLLGSGGSILTVPILVYVLGQPDKVAIAGSLAIVGGISLVGAVPYALRRLIDWRSVVYFGAPGMVGAFGGAALARFVDGSVQLLAFAVLMLVAAVFMMRGNGLHGTEARPAQAWWKIALEGLTVGVVTGLVGVGGGFLIVPALALLGGLPIHVAIGTSLSIIALKSFVGFYEYLHVLGDLQLRLDWTVVLLFTATGVGGSFLGGRIAAQVSQIVLRRTFALFLVLVGSFIVWENAGAFF
jgi:uncharacterized membrane protein YfcA